MKAIVTNKLDANIKAEYNHVINISVQTYHDEQCGYDGKPMWVLELFEQTASFKCSDWNIDLFKEDQ